MKNKSNNIQYFDIDEDWNTIIGSFSTVHNMRLKQTPDDEMDWDEFLVLLYELLQSECSFQRLVSIRSTPSDKYADLDEYEKKVWLDWRQRHPECVTHTKKLTLKDLFGDEEED